MKKKIAITLISLIGLHIFSGKFSDVLAFNKGDFMHSLVFEPFSWFFALISFILSFLTFSKMLFLLQLPSVKKEQYYEKIVYGVIILFAILFYRLAALLVLGVAVGYAIMESIDYSKRIERYSRREKN